MVAPVPPAGLARLFNRAGELVQMPVKAPLRREFLAWVTSTLPAGRELPEPEVNELLRPIHPDVAMLRRYLVDEALVERPRPGVYVVRAASSGTD